MVAADADGRHPEGQVEQVRLLARIDRRVHPLVAKLIVATHVHLSARVPCCMRVLRVDCVSLVKM